MDDTFEKYYNLTLRFLSFRPRSEKEVKDYLEKKFRKSPNENLISSIVKKLKEKNFLNDLEFADFWFEQRTKGRPKALRIIKLELRNKGVSQEIIEELSGRFGKTVDLQSAKKLVQKNFRKFEKLPKNEAYSKMFQFLARRGFDFDLIKKVIADWHS